MPQYLAPAVYVEETLLGPPPIRGVSTSTAGFLRQIWRAGALMGAKPKEAFFVRADRTTMAEADLSNGRLIVEIGMALVRPAEFVVIRVMQKTSEAD